MTGSPGYAVTMRKLLPVLLLLLAAALPLGAQTAADVRIEKRICRERGTTVFGCAGPNLTSSPAGSTVLFHLFVPNFGPGAASNITITDVLPPNVMFESIDTSTSGGATCTTPPPGTAGGTVTCTGSSLSAPPPSAVFAAIVRIYVRISPATPEGTTIVNTATASSPEPDPNPANNTATATLTVTPALVPTLSQWALILAMAALACAGALALRR